MKNRLKDEMVETLKDGERFTGINQEPPGKSAFTAKKIKEVHANLKLKKNRITTHAYIPNQKKIEMSDDMNTGSNLPWWIRGFSGNIGGLFHRDSRLRFTRKSK